MLRIAVCFLLMLSVGTVFASECVVLLHGLARTSSSLREMQHALEEDGYYTANVDYPSRDHEIAELATIAVGEGLATCRAIEDVEKIHFVTHSLGSILVRQ